MWNMPKQSLLITFTKLEAQDSNLAAEIWNFFGLHTVK